MRVLRRAVNVGSPRPRLGIRWSAVELREIRVFLVLPALTARAGRPHSGGRAMPGRRRGELLLVLLLLSSGPAAPAGRTLRLGLLAFLLLVRALVDGNELFKRLLERLDEAFDVGRAELEVWRRTARPSRCLRRACANHPATWRRGAHW